MCTLEVCCDATATFRGSITTHSFSLVPLQSTLEVYCIILWMLHLQADQRVLRQFVVTYLPETDHVLKEHDIGKLSQFLMVAVSIF